MIQKIDLILNSLYEKNVAFPNVLINIYENRC